MLQDPIEHDSDYITVPKIMAIVNPPKWSWSRTNHVYCAQHGEYKIVKNNVVTWAKTEVNMAKKYGEGTTGLKLS